MKCWHCGDDHAASKCTKEPCTKCGKRYCGALRGLSCMITDGIPEGARGVDGKPLDARVVENIKKAIENKKSGGLLHERGGLSLSSRSIRLSTKRLEPTRSTSPMTLAIYSSNSWPLVCAQKYRRSIRCTATRRSMLPLPSA